MVQFYDAIRRQMRTVDDMERLIVGALDEEAARKVFRLIDALEDSDDVQNVYANFDVSDDVLAAVEA